MDKNPDIILQYIDGLLSEEETTKFESQMQSDSELRKEVDMYRDMQSYVKHKDQTQQALASLAEVHRDMTAKPEEAPYTGRKKKSPWKWLSMIIVIAGILGLGLLSLIEMFEKPENVEPEILFAEYFDPSEVSFTSRGDNTDQDLLTAAEAFNASNFKDASDILSDKADGPDTNDRVSYALGISLIGQGEWQEGINVLRELAQNNEVYADDANWYIALALLSSEGNTRETRASLARVSKASNRYKKAQELLSRLGE